MSPIATKKVQVHLKETVPSKSRELCLLIQVSYQTVAAVILSQKVTINLASSIFFEALNSFVAPVDS